MATKSSAKEAPSAAEIVAQLKSLGTESYKRTLLRHGVKEPVYGVKIEDLKKIQKRIKKNHQLALELYETGICDAMYLAGLIADEQQMTRKDLQRWLKGASSSLIQEYTVPWVAAASPHGPELALEWINTKDEGIATAGWATLGGIIALKDDRDLDLEQLKELLARVQKTIHSAPNRVRYMMNGFVIALAIYVKPLTEAALRAAEAIGKVTVDMGDTACKVPFAPEYIRKAMSRGSLGKKRKSLVC